ncbi:EamA domain-containing membrane protein RarD [Tenacibaculum adriaticum]|uniref:EamA domain-containing membrane protein RarD n=1 Tax=Tenacibaculum adriaticum TaxID=413713 RepID=A0A5S5DTH0_9FLAO|nr:DMT family transporter [Tenacibaculum adriaticum]TYP98974.1 EamA domain-containing membrane protein RarD [Tenacibaculum adriaticum]
MNPKLIISYFLLVLTMLLWAANFHVVKIALEYYTPMSVATLRFFFGVVSLLILFYMQYKEKIFKIRFSIKEWWYLFLTSFFGIFLTIYFFNIGLKTTSAINGSLIIATSPAITGVLSFLFLRTKINLKQWLAIAISFLGVAIILMKGNFSKLLQLQFEIGDIYILLMAIVFSLSQILVSKYLSHIDAITTTTITSLISFVLFALFSLSELTVTQLPSSIPFWASILFMGVLSTGIAYTAFYYCVVKLGATVSSLSMNLIPFFTLLLAIPFGEKIYGIQLLGGIIIVIGLVLFSFAKKTRPL